MSWFTSLLSSLWGSIFSSSNPVSAVADAVDDIAKVVQNGQNAAQQNNAQQVGVVAQQNKDKADELQALSDDRARDSNDALQLRVGTDHGITSKP